MILLKYDAERGINMGLLTAVFKRKDGVVLFMDKIKSDIDWTTLTADEIVKRYMVVAAPLAPGSTVTVRAEELSILLNASGIIKDPSGMLYALTRDATIELNVAVQGDFLSRGVLILHNTSMLNPIVRYNLITGGLFDTLTVMVDIKDTGEETKLTVEFSIEGISEFADISEGFDLDKMVDKRKLAEVIASTTPYLLDEAVVSNVFEMIDLPFYSEEELYQISNRK